MRIRYKLNGIRNIIRNTVQLIRNVEIVST